MDEIEEDQEKIDHWSGDEEMDEIEWDFERNEGEPDHDAENRDQVEMSDNTEQDTIIDILKQMMKHEEHQNEEADQREEPNHEGLVFSQETNGTESSIEAEIGNQEKEAYLQENEQSFNEMSSEMKDEDKEKDSSNCTFQEAKFDRVNGKEADHEDTEAATEAKEINRSEEESELDCTKMDQEMDKDVTDCQDESVIDIVHEGNIADEDSDTE